MQTGAAEDSRVYLSLGDFVSWTGVQPSTIEVAATGSPEEITGIMHQLEEKLAGVKKSIKIAVLGCVVNGPGEASEADIGIAAGKGVAILYRKGEVVKRVKEEDIVRTVLEEVERFQPQH